jgi:diguanylate cyclase (GGDEF)-like protein
LTAAAPRSDTRAGRLPRPERRRAKERGVLLATAGLFIALAAILALRLLGRTGISATAWLAALAVTLLAQGVLWLIPRRGWDEHLERDPHYLMVPLLVTAGLLNLYGYLAPEARALVPVGWVVALLFMAGLAGFGEVVLLSTAMTAGYLLVMRLLIADGFAVHVATELVLTGTFFAVSIYAGIVFQRLRRDRRDRRRLRQQLSVLAATDALTGLPNRRRFEELLEAEIERVARYGGHCSIALLDVDFFKNYNDTLGHPAGDRILQELADLLRRHLRTTDVVARYGGEEFALLMVHAGDETAHQTTERMRSVVEAYPFPDERIQPAGRLTVSAGVATCPEDGADLLALVLSADVALYHAKRTGRNRVASAPGAAATRKAPVERSLHGGPVYPAKAQ